MREEEPYEVPTFAANADKPLVYVSFGSLGSGDTDLLKRLIAAFAKLPYRALFNVGDYLGDTRRRRRNVHLASWYPQPSVIPLVDAVIHHGGNNSFTECLYFGKPAIIMPYVWDGHDNATRVDETRHGMKMPRYDWSDADLARNLGTLLTDPVMKGNLERASAHMRGRSGTEKAAALLDGLVRDEYRAEYGEAATRDDLVDWGPIATPIEGLSHTSGKVLHKDQGGGESGIWVCTPGSWRCQVEREEFCHFLAGRCTYVHDEGEVIEIVPDTIAVFPAGWTGRCTVHATIRKVYAIR